MRTVNPLPPNVPDLEHQICQWTTNGSQEDVECTWYTQYKVSNGLIDFKVALYVYPIRTDDGIYSDHGYLDTLEIPLGPP